MKSAISIHEFVILANSIVSRVSVQGVKSLGGHFACLCWGVEFYEVKKKMLLFFKIIFIVKSLQKEQNSTNLLLWLPICRNKPAITPKWFNSLDTNLLSICTGILGTFDILQFEISSLMNWFFFLSLKRNWLFLPVQTGFFFQVSGLG